MPQYYEGRSFSYSSYTGDPFIDSLVSGYQWTSNGGTTNLTFSFPWLNGASAYFNYGGEPDVLHGGVTAEQRIEILGAFEAWSNVANITFTEVAEDTAGTVGDLRLGFSEQVGDWWGWAYYPTSAPIGGDIWVHTRYMGDSFAPGTYNFYSTLHEIGHALGLQHSFGGAVTMPIGYDSRLYTVMSYTDPATAWWWNQATGQSEYLVRGPMVYDIQAIQHLYGANMSYRAGSDSYMFDPSHPFIEAIWDAGGTDVIDLSNFGNSCTVDLTPGSYSSLGFNDMAAFQNLGIAFDCIIEDATGGLAGDVLLGNDVGNRLSGGGGDDVLDGRFGDDWLEGGSGNDQLSGGGGFDTVVYDGALAAVTVNLSAADGRSTAAGDIAGVGIDVLIDIENIRGSRFDDLLIGSALGNRLEGGNGQDRLEGLDGNDLLIGGAGIDMLIGGLGDDRYILTALDDIIVENAGEGLDTLQCDFTLSLAGFVNVECIQLTGSLDINATGDALGNVLTGNAGANRLFGGLGNDTLDGLAGLDRMYGGAGNDVYYVRDATDYAYELAGEGIDVVRASISHTLRAEVENLTLSGTASIYGRGNDLANTITGNSGSNKLYGLAGDDRLYGGDGDDTLEGGAGVDRLYGGTGHDRYIVSDSTDYAYENAGEGIDRVYASITHTLRANVEYLYLTGTDAINGTGNDLGNVIEGNGAANVLKGGLGDDKLYGQAGDDIVMGEVGNDLLEGGAGRDRFFGGTGADRFVFRDGDFASAVTNGSDQIHDFSAAERDSIRLDQVDADRTQAGNQAFTFLGTDAFTGSAGQLRYQQISGNTYVQGDTDGDGVADFMIRLDGLHTLSSANFLL